MAGSTCSTFRRSTPRLLNLPMTISRRPSQAGGVFGRERDLVFLRHDFRDAPLEIKASRQFLARLIERVINFLRVHFRDDIERRHDDFGFWIFDFGVQPRDGERLSCVTETTEPMIFPDKHTQRRVSLVLLRRRPRHAERVRSRDLQGTKSASGRGARGPAPNSPTTKPPNLPGAS